MSRTKQMKLFETLKVKPQIFLYVPNKFADNLKKEDEFNLGEILSGYIPIGKVKILFKIEECVISFLIKREITEEEFNIVVKEINKYLGNKEQGVSFFYKEQGEIKYRVIKKPVINTDAPVKVSFIEDD